MNCTDCRSELAAKLCDIPSQWATQIADILCNERESASQSHIICEDVKNCETLTVLNAFVVNGTTVSISYKDEAGVTVTRSFDMSSAINNLLDDIDPKCVATVIDWQSMTFVQRFQALIDKQCECCDTGNCPETSLLAIDGNFNITWDNTNVNSDPNVISLRLSKRVKNLGGSFLTTGFTPPNDISKTLSAATTTGLTNTIYEYKLDTICAQGGPTGNIAGIREGITFECITPTTVINDTSIQVTIGLTNLDISRVRFTLKKTSDNSTVSGPFEVSKSAGNVTTTINSLLSNTSYYLQMEYIATVNGVEVISSNVSYLGSPCVLNFNTLATTTTTTTTTTTSTTTTTTTTTTSTTTTTTAGCVTYRFTNINVFGGPAIIVNYLDCNYVAQAEVIGTGVSIERCAIHGSYSGPTSLSVTLLVLGGCSTTTTSTTTSTSTTTTTTIPPSTTTTTTGATSLIYFGAKSGSTPPIEAQLLGGSSMFRDAMIDVPIDWTPFNAVPQSCWFAIPDALGGTSIKNFWYVNLINNGAIGSPSDLFDTYTIVTVSGINYKVWITNYDTQFVGICNVKNAP